jgi:tetratricopeptide (TPR) repeat protein
MAANPERVQSKRLDSWKEIAAFLDRAERTVKRWETERGLPVHRVPGGGRSAVFAYGNELADWLQGQGPEQGEDGASDARSDTPISGTSLSGTSLSRTPVRVKTRIPARLVAWVVPLALAAGLIAFLWIGHSASRFKAMASRHAPNEEAQELYLKGRYFWDRRTPEDLSKAIDYFTQAIVKDPSDAQAYTGLADCYNLLREFGAMPPGEAYPRALAAAQRAVELDNNSAEAHLSLAFATYWWQWRAVTAEREFRRALELNPNLERAHHWYATFLLGNGRFSESLDQIEQARRLNPSSNALLADKGKVLWDAGRKAESVALLTQLETTDPSLSSTHTYLGDMYWSEKDYARALPEMRRAAELRADRDGIVFANIREKGFAENGLQGLYESELPMQKEQVDGGAGNAYSLAATYAALGKKREALECLQISFERHEAAMLMGDQIPELQYDPEYQNLRAQVRQMLGQ